MKIVFVSNYYNHHQSAVSMALDKLTNGQYTFIQTEPMSEERLKLGYGNDELPRFVISSYGSDECYKLCMRHIKEADLVIAGGEFAVERMIQRRIKAGKLVFRYSERVYKNAKAEKQKLLRGIKYHLCNFPYKNVYLLSASAYAAADYAKTGNFVGKAYKWGYFPEVKKYDEITALMAQKDSKMLLWVGRMIDWKHAELCIAVAEKLKAEDYEFHLNLIGTGPLEEKLRTEIEEKGLADHVKLLGAMKPRRVREYMERAGIYLFTSDFNEGWGAVLNESMNSGCAVVASHAVGAAPFLIKDGVNGYLFKNGDIECLHQKVKYLLDYSDAAASLGVKAYQTLADTWNAEVAAERLIALADRVLSGEQTPRLYEAGPCSMAEILENDWYAAAYTE